MSIPANTITPESRRFSIRLPQPVWIIVAASALSLEATVAGYAADQKSGVNSPQAAEPDPAFASLPRIEQDAVAALKKVGAQVVVRVKAIRSDEAGGDKSAQLTGIVVVVGKQWIGGDDDLRHVLDLSTLQALYVVGSERVSDKALDKRRKARPKVKVGRRPGAMLGLMGTPHAKGLEIGNVLADSAADRAGLREGDILIEFAGEPVSDIMALQSLMLPLKPRQKIATKLLRDGETMSVTVELGEWSN